METNIKTNVISTNSNDLSTPIVSDEERVLIDRFYKEHPELSGVSIKKIDPPVSEYMIGSDIYKVNEPWVQTYSGRRFNPTNPSIEAIVIQDIAHSLSQQCRYAGHSRVFYSVAQHSVLVSYICNFEDALWGLLHDASEAYLVDLPSPLKRNEQFKTYRDFELKMQNAVCERFKISLDQPDSVTKADKILLATEAVDLLKPIRSDWYLPAEPLPFKIEPLYPQEAEKLFMKRFFDLVGDGLGYQQYLDWLEWDNHNLK